MLEIGLPYWAVLQPQERVELLAHELGHFVNGDLSRGLLTQPTVTIFQDLAILLDPSAIFWVRDDEEPLILILIRTARMTVGPFLTILCWLCRLIHFGLCKLWLSGRQRAEYYADDVAAAVAGTGAALSGHDLMLNGEAIRAVVGSRARGQLLAAGWRDAVAQTREAMADRLPMLRQWSLRNEASLFSTHPPTGMRHALLSAAPYRSPSVVLSQRESDLIDAELAKYEEPYRRVIAMAW